MTCSQCQRENPVDAKFCNACGVQLDAACPQCGRVNLPCSQFCTLLAEVCGRAAQEKDGLAPLREAFTVSEKNGEGYYTAELYRLKGELTLQQ